jgi:hypothetical protein
MVSFFLRFALLLASTCAMHSHFELPAWASGGRMARVLREREEASMTAHGLQTNYTPSWWVGDIFNVFNAIRRSS